MTTPKRTISPVLARGWRLKSISRPRGLAGANGLRIGPDGALYVVSAFGSEVARVGIETGERSIIATAEDDIISPDDVAFDGEVMYVTQCMNAKVTAFVDGSSSVVVDDLSGANGIDVRSGRMFVSQFLPSGKVWEVFLDSRPPRLLAKDLPGPNGLCASPDGHVYFVQVFTGDVMRVPMDGGRVERMATGLSAPSSVRVGPNGTIYISQGGDGRISTLDPRTRELKEFARSRPGIDNLAVHDDGRVFISYYIDGAVYEITGRGQLRELIPPGLLGPYGIAATSTAVHVADGFAAATLADDGEVTPVGKFTDPGFPGYLRGLAATDDGQLLATTSEGRAARYEPETGKSEVLTDTLSEPMGIAAWPDGGAFIAEAGRSRVIFVSASGETSVVADELRRPVGVALDPAGTVFVSDEERGTVERIGDRPAVLADGLNHPHDICVMEDRLLVAEAGAARLLSIPIDGGAAAVIASHLPIGTGNGVRGTLSGLPEMVPGPISPFAGIDTDNAGRVFIAGDALGVVLVLERTAPV